MATQGMREARLVERSSAADLVSLADDVGAMAGIAAGAGVESVGCEVRRRMRNAG